MSNVDDRKVMLCLGTYNLLVIVGLLGGVLCSTQYDWNIFVMAFNFSVAFFAALQVLSLIIKSAINALIDNLDILLEVMQDND